MCESCCAHAPLSALAAMCSVGPLNADSLAVALQWDYTNVVMNWVILRRKGADRNLEWLKYFDAVRAQIRWGSEGFDTLTWRVPRYSGAGSSQARLQPSATPRPCWDPVPLPASPARPSTAHERPCRL